MEALETIKSKTQTNFTYLLEQVQSQPDEVKVWGITAGSAVAGALAMTAAANGVLALLATLASPPIALTVGALGGGIAGWTYVHKQQGTHPSETSLADPISETVTPIAVVAVPDAVVEQTAVSGISEEATVESVAPTPAESSSEVFAGEPVTVATTDESNHKASSGESVTEPTDETDAPVLADNLEAINGIGPVYAGRLQAAGVTTFVQLAQLTPERIHEILGSIRLGHRVDPEKWIGEARQLAEQK